MLVVDDDAPNLEMLLDQLAEAGVAAVGAESAEEALSIIARYDVSYVLSDIQMSPLGGFDLLERLEGRLPIALMSAFASDEVRSKAIAGGARAVLAKPFRAEELLRVLAEG